MTRQRKNGHRSSVGPLSCEALESRLCLSEIPFALHMISEGDAVEPWSVFAADLDQWYSHSQENRSG